MFTETDLSISHRYRFGRDNRFTLEGFLDLRNLFNERNVLGLQTNLSSTNFNALLLQAGGCTTCVVLNPTGSVNAALSEAAVFQTIFNGGGIRQFVLNYLANPSTPLASRQLNTYGQPNSFQSPRDVRFGFRVFF
jgi:hypothetical protein